MSDVARLDRTGGSAGSAEWFCQAGARVKRGLHVVEVASGALLIIAGILIFTNKLQYFSKFLNFLPSAWQ